MAARSNSEQRGCSFSLLRYRIIHNAAAMHLTASTISRSFASPASSSKLYIHRASGGHITGDCRIHASSGRVVRVNTKLRAKSAETVESRCIDSARSKFAETQTHLIVSAFPGGELLKRTEIFDLNKEDRNMTADDELDGEIKGSIDTLQLGDNW